MQKIPYRVALNPSWHLLWILALLEGVTVPILAFFTEQSTQTAEAKSLWHGFLIGFIGTLIVIWVVNRILPILKIPFNQEKIRQIGPLLIAAIWGGLVLLFIFGLQRLVNYYFPANFYLRPPLLGFISATGSLLIVFGFYTFLQRVSSLLSINIDTATYRYQLCKLPFLLLALLIGIYEAVAFPILSLWQHVPGPVILMALVFGLLGGFIGALVVILLAKLAWIKKYLVMDFARS